MAPKGTFETLGEFQTAIESTHVSFQGKACVSLVDGLGLAVRMLNELRMTSHKAIFLGNGGSSSIASHQALDLWNHGKIRALSFNDAALLTCMANDFGYEQVFSKPLEMFCDPGDLVIAISSSGKSPNIIKAAEVALKKRARLIGFSGFKVNNPLKRLGQLHFYVPSQIYGVVETAHALLIHAIMDELSKGIKSSKRIPSFQKRGIDAPDYILPLPGDASNTPS